jgi:hypothetical protein
MRRCCYAFDPIEHDGDDLRDLPLIERKRRLARLLGSAKRRAIRFTEHLTGDGPTVCEHVCRMGLEGIVSKRTDAPYRSGLWDDNQTSSSQPVVYSQKFLVTRHGFCSPDHAGRSPHGSS